MLATRSLRLAATRYYTPAVYAWSAQTKTPIKLQQTTTWYTTPIAAAYSKDAKSGVLNSLSFIIQKRCNASMPASKLTTESSTLPTMVSKTSSNSSPLNMANKTDISESSKSSPPSDQPTKSDAPSSSSSPPPSNKSISFSTQCDQNETDKESSFAGPLNKAGVKLPSREQVEGFLFKALVYIWDFSLNVFALSRKLFATYVWNNPTVQCYWKALLKRMEDARKEIKSK